MGLRIVTWNVNGIKNPFAYQPWRTQRTYQAMFDILEADIVIMQELKIQQKDLSDDMVLVPGWDVYFNFPKQKKGKFWMTGYSGVAIYTRNASCAPIRAEHGITGYLCPPKSTTSYRELPKEQQIGGYLPRESTAIDPYTLDSEGRCVILEFPAFVLFGFYLPANRDESRDDFRTAYFEAVDARIRNLVAEGKEVVITGDLNVVASEIDTSVKFSSKEERDAWLSTPPRRIFSHLLHGGTPQDPRDADREPILWDLCRRFHPNRQGMNTCWDTKKNTRPANFGSRIDYVLCSNGIVDWFTAADIKEGLMGSDHCPVFATMADTVPVDGKQAPLSDMVNPPGMFKEGERQREWSTGDLLPMSGRLLEDFRRQNIRDMFKAMGSGNRPASVSTGISTSVKTPVMSSNPTKQRQGTSKRPAEPDSRSLKRTKSTGQTTLQAFMRPTVPKPKTESLPAGAALEPPIPSTPPASSRSSADPGAPQATTSPDEAKARWRSIMGDFSAPRCEHEEPCIILVTKKKGMNHGRAFYICPRPLGPSGENERGTEWRCKTFIWKSDWPASSKDNG